MAKGSNVIDEAFNAKRKLTTLEKAERKSVDAARKTYDRVVERVAKRRTDAATEVLEGLSDEARAILSEHS